MLKVADAVRTAIWNSEMALASLSNGVLNLSAYAKLIQADVEKATMKPVKLGTIVAALARIGRELEHIPPLSPTVVLQDIAIKSGLCEIAFEQTEANRESLQRLYSSKKFAAAEFFTATHGVGELSIVTNEKQKQTILDSFSGQKPKLVMERLCALTVRFSEDYITIPGQTFWLVRQIALERLNIVEVISTFTELTFLLHEADINKALAVFTPHLQASR